MRDPSYNIRVAVADLLTGIQYNGTTVFVFDEIVAPDAGFPRIVLLDVSGGGARLTKCGFGADWSQVIKVCSSFTGRVTKNMIDIISNEVLSRLVPFTGDFIDIGPDFHVWNVEASVIGVQNYTDGSKQFIDKNLRITYSLTEK